MSETTGEINWDTWEQKIDWVSEKWNNGIPAHGDKPEDKRPSLAAIADYAQKVFCNPKISKNVITGIKSRNLEKFNTRPPIPKKPKVGPIKIISDASTLPPLLSEVTKEVAVSSEQPSKISHAFRDNMNRCCQVISSSWEPTRFCDASTAPLSSYCPKHQNS